MKTIILFTIISVLTWANIVTADPLEAKEREEFGCVMPVDLFIKIKGCSDDPEYCIKAYCDGVDLEQTPIDSWNG